MRRSASSCRTSAASLGFRVSGAPSPSTGPGPARSAEQGSAISSGWRIPIDNPVEAHFEYVKWSYETYPKDTFYGLRCLLNGYALRELLPRRHLGALRSPIRTGRWLMCSKLTDGRRGMGLSTLSSGREALLSLRCANTQVLGLRDLDTLSFQDSNTHRVWGLR